MYTENELTKTNIVYISSERRKNEGNFYVNLSRGEENDDETGTFLFVATAKGGGNAERSTIIEQK